MSDTTSSGPRASWTSVHDAGVRIVAKLANSLDLDQHILSCDIAEERYNLKKREESSDG